MTVYKLFYIIIGAILTISLAIVLLQDLQLFPGVISGLAFKGTRPKEFIPNDIHNYYVDVNGKNQVETWYYKGSSGRTLSDYNVIFFHGNAETLEDAHQVQEWLDKLGLSTLTFSYRGYAYSTGWPSAKHLLEDALKVWAFAVSELKFQPEKTIFVGRSIGTGPATYLASQVKPGALVLISPYTSLKVIVQSRSFLKYFAPFLWNNINQAEDLSKLDPKLCLAIVHGENDSIIPVSQSQQLYESLPDKSRTFFKRYPGAEHVNVIDFAKEDIEQQLINCLKRN